jgi:hypothetical protein
MTTSPVVDVPGIYFSRPSYPPKVIATRDRVSGSSEEDFPPELGYRNLVLRDPEGNEFCVGCPSDAAPRS